MRVWTILAASMVCLLTLAMATTDVSPQYPATHSVIPSDESQSLPAQLTPHSPIAIYSNDDFGPLGFTGNGSETNPYMIELLDIKGSLDTSCILIGGLVTASFVVKACRVSGSLGTFGLELYGGHGLVEESLVFNCSCGVLIAGDTREIRSCEIFNCSTGVVFMGGTHELTSCEIHDCEQALFAETVSELAVQGSNLHDNYVVELHESAVTLIDNTLTNCTAYVANGGHIAIENNTFRAEEGRDPLILSDCSNGAILDNLFHFDTVIGLRLLRCEDMVIRSCEFVGYGVPYTPHDGIRFAGPLETNNITVEDCIFQSAGLRSEDRYSGEELTLKNSNFTDGSIFMYNSRSADVRNNIIHNGSLTLINCSLSYIHNNTLLDCEDDGIVIGENNSGLVVRESTLTGKKTAEGYGIAVGSNDIAVAFNRIESFDVGIHVTGIGATIYNNTVAGNNIGIQIAAGSNSSHLYYNILYNNVRNGVDDGNGNVWDDGVSLGNYWSDLSTPGQYTIPGTAGSIDRYAQPYGNGIDLSSVILVVGVLGAVAVVVVLGVRHRHA